ncbi:hypothetical protein ACI1US_00098 [Leucobacter sp. BZR 635]
MTAAQPPTATLRTLDEVKKYLAESPQPIFYISRSATNLLGVDRAVGGFRYITLSDSWDGRNPRSFAPSNVPKLEPRGNVNVVNWLLGNEQVQAYIRKNTPAGYTPQVVIAMFDEATQRLCQDLGYELIMPQVKLREHLDSKIVTTQIGNDAGAQSVPNVLTTASGWEDLRAQAQAAQLGEDLVVQLPYGDSGRTTFFISSQADFDRVAGEISGSGSAAPTIKIMRRINHLSFAADAVITRSGTIVGPVLREITGHPELTQYKGGWAGSELYPSLISEETRQRAISLVQRFSDRLAQEGYRGTLGIDLLVDTDTGEVYLGELNPRITGSSSHSNLQGFSSAPGGGDPASTLPLFAYHVLEYSGADFTLDIAEIQAERARALEGQTWSTLVIQHARPQTERTVVAPRTGRYRVGAGGSLEFVSPDIDWQEISEPGDAFWFRSSGPGEIVAKGVDVGMLITRRRSQEEHYALTDDTKQLITAIQSKYEGRRIPTIQLYWRAGLEPGLAGVADGDDGEWRVREVGCDGLDLVCGHGREAVERGIEVVEFSRAELGAGEPAHAGLGVFECERRGARDLPE